MKLKEYYKITYLPFNKQFVGILESKTDDIYHFITEEKHSNNQWYDFYVVEREIGQIYEIEELDEIDKILYNN